MLADSVKFKGATCFSSTWSGFDEIKPINVIIGRNNTGKSRLLEFVEHLCGDKLGHEKWDTKLTAILEEKFLRTVFETGKTGANLGANDHWIAHGRHFVGQAVTWEMRDNQSEITYLDTPVNQEKSGYKHQRSVAIQSKLYLVKCRISDSVFRQIFADRDIQPEISSTEIALSRNGDGASNLIRRYITSVSLPQDLIQRDLLRALNEIFSEDGQFTEIQVRQHDEKSNDRWEVFLGEKSKGLIPLSQSGSGLKTIILVLLNILVLPEQSQKTIRGHVFAFEELENNLHPALQRRLMRFLAKFARATGATFFLTTHSNVTLDVFSRESEAQIIHVSHDGTSARTQTVEAHFDRAGIVSELGAKPSDLLQANGVLWLEGPSDRIYLNRWIQLFSSGKLVEGLDYQCAFYGGSVLARTQFASPEDSDEELANLLRINPNIVVVCDGDRTAEKGKGSRIKKRVQRIRSELEQIPGSTLWITAGKEIESYLTVASLADFATVDATRAPQIHERIFPSTSKQEAGKSYCEKVLKRRSVDKIALAMHAAPLMTKADLMERFELAAQVEAIVRAIRGWGQ
ncbi:AAA family ATPase [Rhodopirellula europaea]|uniref:AAA family ATPase n=1 Tax=Rhodopirellula europaea TaxID=1263866 RepID=UPI003D2BA6EC